MLCYPFPTDNFKKYTKKTNPKITILEILLYKIQPEIMESKIFTRFSFITKPLCNKVETRREIRVHYFWLYFAYQNFQNGYLWEMDDTTYWYKTALPEASVKAKRMGSTK